MADNTSSYTITPGTAAASSSRINVAKRSWGGSAFILESLLLIVFFIASFAIILMLLSTSYAKGQQAEEITNAVMLASQDAETFALDPTSTPEPKHYAMGSSGEMNEKSSYDPSVVYTVVRNVSTEETGAGILYKAHITVNYGSKEVYAIDTAKYVANSESNIAPMSATASSVVSGIAI